MNYWDSYSMNKFPALVHIYCSSFFLTNQWCKVVQNSLKLFKKSFLVISGLKNVSDQGQTLITAWSWLQRSSMLILEEFGDDLDKFCQLWRQTVSNKKKKKKKKKKKNNFCHLMTWASPQVKRKKVSYYNSFRTTTHR